MQVRHWCDVLDLCTRKFSLTGPRWTLIKYLTEDRNLQVKCMHCTMNTFVFQSSWAVAMVAKTSQKDFILFFCWCLNPKQGQTWRGIMSLECWRPLLFCRYACFSTFLQLFLMVSLNRHLTCTHNAFGSRVPRGSCQKSHGLCQKSPAFYEEVEDRIICYFKMQLWRVGTGLLASVRKSLQK